MTTLGCLLLCFGCDSGGGGSSDPDAGASAGDGGEPAGGWVGSETPETLTYAGAYEQMGRLARAPGLVKENLGDAAAYLQTGATTPTREDELASLYYETGGFAEAVSRARDTREGIDDREAGAGIASAVATALTIGFTSETPSGRRGSPRWHALTAARVLDYYLLLAVHQGLEERSAEGYDRAWAALWRGSVPHGLGSTIVAADRACGTGYLEEAQAKLRSIREPLAAALEAHGLPDALDRLVIEEGDCPECDAAIPEVAPILVKGLGTAMLLALSAELDANVQAEALAAYRALSPSVRLADGPSDGMVSSALDAMNPAEIDVAAVRGALETHLGVSCAN